MAKQWRMIRVPADLADRLDAMRRQYDQLHTESIVELPGELVDRGCTHWYVIQQALDRVEEHRQRARRQRTGSGQRRQEAGDMYTQQAEGQAV